MRFFSRALTGLLLSALTLGLLAFAALTLEGALRDRAARDPGARAAREQVFAANVVTVAPRTLTPVLATFGEIRARRNLEIRATAPGRVVEIGDGVEDGGQVRQGQLIVAIDPSDAETALALARADLTDAQAERDDAERALTLAADDLQAARDQSDLRDRALARQRDLESRGVGTAATVEESEFAAAAARQQVVSRRQAEAQAQARLAQAETQLSRRRVALDEAARALDETRVTAAFDGTISDLDVSLGGLVSQNERLADLIDPGALEIAFRVSTADYMRLLDADGRLAARDAEVVLDLGATDLSSPATITRESPAVAEGESGRRLFARLEAPRGFRPGDFARIRISEPPLRNVARLPAAAVGPSGGVLLLDDDDRLTPATVEPLRSQGDTVIVRAPDLAGREVVAERSPLLGAGIKVRPLRQDAPPQEAGDGTQDTAEAEMLELTPERRAALIAVVESDRTMADDARARLLAQLREGPVPARMVERLEGARGG
ncbi:efflux RND transporter periplasmic adaptor subunit [Palleronia rufa]|uniref:efflux RND transporter periplasmic adaptor subunit n=1 Tax=Palleronia rufa TaxID=1530186 RepID=UPI00056B5367|nr:HlyD family efflux transporter periplasmic adaptor subunit [Palleronia rufa]